MGILVEEVESVWVVDILEGRAISLAFDHTDWLSWGLILTRESFWGSSCVVYESSGLAGAMPKKLYGWVGGVKYE